MYLSTNKNTQKKEPYINKLKKWYISSRKPLQHKWIYFDRKNTYKNQVHYNTKGTNVSKTFPVSLPWTFLHCNNLLLLQYIPLVCISAWTASCTSMELIFRCCLPELKSYEYFYKVYSSVRDPFLWYILKTFSCWTSHRTISHEKDLWSW